MGFVFLQIYALLIPLVLLYRYRRVRREFRSMAGALAPSLSEQEMAYLVGGAHHVVLTELAELVWAQILEVAEDGKVRRGSAGAETDTWPPIRLQIYSFVHEKSQASFEELLRETDGYVQDVSSSLLQKGYLRQKATDQTAERQSWIPVLALASVGLARVIYNWYKGNPSTGLLGMIGLLLGFSYFAGVSSALSPAAVTVLVNERERSKGERNLLRHLRLWGLPYGVSASSDSFLKTANQWRSNGQYQEGVGVKMQNWVLSSLLSKLSG